MCLYPWQPGIKDQRPTALSLRQSLCMGEKKFSNPAASVLFVSDDPGQITGFAGHPECIQVHTVAETVIYPVVRYCKKAGISIIGKNLTIKCLYLIPIIGVIVPKFFYI